MKVDITEKMRCVTQKCLIEIKSVGAATTRLRYEGQDSSPGTVGKETKIFLARTKASSL